MYQPDVDTGAQIMAMQMLGVPCACPGCGQEWSDQVARSFVAGGRCFCVKCKWYGNWRSGTILNKRHLSARHFIVLFSAFSLFPEPTLSDYKRISERTDMSVEYLREWRGIITDYLARVNA